MTVGGTVRTSRKASGSEKIWLNVMVGRNQAERAAGQFFWPVEGSLVSGKVWGRVPKCSVPAPLWGWGQLPLCTGIWLWTELWAQALCAPPAWGHWDKCREDLFQSLHINSSHPLEALALFFSTSVQHIRLPQQPDLKSWFPPKSQGTGSSVRTPGDGSLN